MKALFIHPKENVYGNILWPLRPSVDELEQLENARDSIVAKGYWVSFFLEGDGMAFSKDTYQPELGLADFRTYFDFVDFHEATGSGIGAALGALVPDATIVATCLVPVTSLRLLDTFTIGKTTFHTPVDGSEIRLADHSWGMELCDEMGAEMRPDWQPESDLHCDTTAGLLAYPLIERVVNIPAKLLYEARDSMSGIARLLNFIIHDADRALDLLRWAFCSYKKLEYLPNRAGWKDGFAYAYVLPSFGTKAGLYCAKPHVLRVENNWLGLEVDFNPDDDDIRALAKIVDGTITDPIAKDVKSALRAFGQAFYLVDPEASFLSIVYAIDALCDVGNLTGPRQRAWVVAAATKGNAQEFEKLLSQYRSLYEIRNEIVHGGETFASLGVDSSSSCQQMMTILCMIILNVVRSQFSSRSNYVDQVLARLQQSDHESILRASYPKAIRYPISLDENFSKVISNRSTSF